MPSHLLILCCPLLLLPSIFHSVRVFSNDLALRIRWPNYWSFTFSISPSNVYSWPVFFRIDCCDLLAVQGTLECLLQHHNSKSSIQCSAFFMVQLSHLYMTTGRTIALTIRTFVGKWRLCFLICYVCHSSSSKEQVSFNCMASVTFCSVSCTTTVKGKMYICSCFGEASHILD